MDTRFLILAIYFVMSWPGNLGVLLHGQVEPQENPSAFFEQWSLKKVSSSGYRPTQPLLQMQRIEKSKMLDWATENVRAPFTSCEFIGPADVGGRTRALLISGDRVFAGSIGGGLWVSNDRGGSWTPVNGSDQLGSMIVSCLTQDPHDSRQIYFGTGEAFKESFYGGGIWRSLDGGHSFELLVSTEDDVRFLYCLCLEHDKRSSSTLYVGTKSPAHIQNPRDYGLLRSNDRGNSWQTVLDHATVCDVLTFPDGSVLAACMGRGVYHSPTGLANTFSRVNSTCFPREFQLIQLAQCHSHPNIVYAAFEGLPQAEGPRMVTPVTSIVKSDDGGRTWTLQCSFLRAGPLDCSHTHNNYCFSLAVDPNNASRLVCGTVVLHYSEDAGLTWRRAGESHVDYHCFASFTDGSDGLLVGNDGGIYRYLWSDLAADPISCNRGYNVTQFYGGDCFAAGSQVIGGTRDNGTRLSDGRVASFYGDGGDCFVSHADSTAVVSDCFMYTLDPEENLTRGLAVSEPIGTTGDVVLEGRPFHSMMIDEQFNYINRFVVNPAEHNQIYCRTNAALWRSTNRGVDWMRLTTGKLPGIDAIACSHSASPTIFFGGNWREASPDRTQRAWPRGAFLYRIPRANNARPGSEVDLRWSIPFCVRNDVLGCLEIDPSDSNAVYAGFSDYSAAPRLWRVETGQSSFLGVRWTDISGNLTAEWQGANAVNTLAVDPNQSRTHLFAGTDRGLYYTVNGGRHWSKYLAIPNTIITQLCLRASDRTLFVFTHGRGVWKVTLR